MANTKNKTTNQVQNTQPANFGYSGNITVSIKKGNRTIATKKFKNNGTKLLFEFLCKCLAGRFTEANEIIPNQLKLFHIDTTEKPSSVRDREFIIGETDVPISVMVPVNSVAKISIGHTDGTSSKNDYGETTLHFLIPAGFITDNKSINTICLYGKNISDTESNYNKYSAFYLCTDGEDKGSNEEWADIEISADTSLTIEWTMKIGNGITTSGGNE